MEKRAFGFLASSTDQSCTSMYSRCFVPAPLSRPSPPSEAPMNAAISAATALSPFHFSLLSCHIRQKPLLRLSISSSLFGGGGGRRPPDPRRTRQISSSKPSPPPERHLEISLDADAIVARASAAAARLRRSSEEGLRRFVTAGSEAYDDLRTSVRVDRGHHRVVFACRQSSLLFFGNLILWSFAAVLAARAVAWLVLGFRSQWRFENWTMVRRDRSLGGREVVVGRKVKNWEMGRGFHESMNPLSPARGSKVKIRENEVRRTSKKKEEKLPSWWPISLPSPVVTVGKHEYQREADRLVRAIMAYRMSGKDYRNDDIVQLRQICRVSGSKVSFETGNARDSFYRASVNFVLNLCTRELKPNNNFQIDGEEPRQFIAGLANNIGLDNSRAATIVCGAVAAFTRSHLLQCWALEVQGKQSEAMHELLKICIIHKTFPPEEHSPEMEMVGSGLSKNFGLEERKHLMNLYAAICDANDHKSVAEALNLLDYASKTSNKDELL